MKLQILEQKKNPFFSRKEITATLAYEQVTPSKEELKKQLNSAMKADADTVFIRHIYTSFGSKTAKVIFCVYDSKDFAKKFEKKPKKPKAVADKKEE